MSNLFQLTSEHKYWDYWKPVEKGEVEPDAYQTEMIRLVEMALDAGMYYTKDVDEWIKNNNDFIPVEAWDWQYKSHKVEGGIMGMEVYMARKVLDEIKRQEKINEGGYTPLTEEMIETAFHAKKKIQLFGSGNVYNPRKVSGKFYLMKPHARNYAIRNDGQPARLVEA